MSRLALQGRTYPVNLVNPVYKTHHLKVARPVNPVQGLAVSNNSRKLVADKAAANSGGAEL